MNKDSYILIDDPNDISIGHVCFNNMKMQWHKRINGALSNIDLIYRIDKEIWAFERNSKKELKHYNKACSILLEQAYADWIIENILLTDEIIK